MVRLRHSMSKIRRNGQRRGTQWATFAPVLLATWRVCGSVRVCRRRARCRRRPSSTFGAPTTPSRTPGGVWGSQRPKGPRAPRALSTGLGGGRALARLGSPAAREVPASSVTCRKPGGPVSSHRRSGGQAPNPVFSPVSTRTHVCTVRLAVPAGHTWFWRGRGCC